MADTGVHLEQRVLPEAPVRHWICSFRWGLRALLGYDKQICAEVLAAVIKELDRSLKRRAKKLLGLSTVKQALTGAVAAVQRVDSALRLNVHFHILGLDGVYVRPYPDNHRSELTFHDLPTPTREETEDIARSIADRVDAILKKHGRSLDPEESVRVGRSTEWIEWGDGLFRGAGQRILLSVSGEEERETPLLTLRTLEIEGSSES